MTTLRAVKKSAVMLTVLIVLAATGCSTTPKESLRAGDVLFQNLPSPSAQAIRLATGSEYSHCGLVIAHKGDLVVCEAVQPVRMIPIEQWIDQGIDKKYTVKRLTDRDPLSTEASKALTNYCLSMIGKPYDMYYQWSDEKIYCSELVWKAYHNGLELDLTTTRSFSDYNFDNPIVQQKLKERFGDNIPWDEPVVSPGDLVNSPKLHTITIPQKSESH